MQSGAKKKINGISPFEIIGAINEQDDYQKNRNDWKYLKTKLQKQQNEVVSATNQLKFLAPDGKNRLADVLDADGVKMLAMSVPNNKATTFLHILTCFSLLCHMSLKDAAKWLLFRV